MRSHIECGMVWKVKLKDAPCMGEYAGNVRDVVGAHGVGCMAYRLGVLTG